MSFVTHIVVVVDAGLEKKSSGNPSLRNLIVSDDIELDVEGAKHHIHREDL